MSVLQLVNLLRDSNIQVSVTSENKLSIKAPAGAMTDNIKSQLRTYKTQLLELLTHSADNRTSVSAMEVVDRQARIPLSYAQQRLWLLNQLDPDSASYNMSTAFLLTGDLDFNAVQKTCNVLVQRHEILRTVYTCPTHNDALDQPTQTILNTTSITIDVYHSNSLQPVFDYETKTLSTHAQQWLTQHSQKPFNLKTDSVLRLQLVNCDESHFILQWVMHHIAVDAWSLDILLQEFTTLYNSACQNADASVDFLLHDLLPIKLQYADFAVWQRRALTEKILNSDLNYWRETLGVNPPVLELPLDRARPTKQTFVGAQIAVDLEPAICEKINRIATEKTNLSVRPFVLLLGSFQKLLNQYSGQDDIRVGVPNANRTHADTQNLVGFFVNTLVMQAQFSDELRVDEFFSQINQRNLEAQDHQHIPFEMLVDELVSEREMSHSPLFQIMFNFLQKDDLQSVDIGNLVISPLAQTQHQAKFDVTLTIETKQNQYTCIFEYNTDLFSTQRIETLAKHYQRIVNRLADAVINSPDTLIRSISVLSSAEIKTQLLDWNESELDVDLDNDLSQRFESQARKTPDATVFIGQDENAGTPTSLSYRNLNNRANQLAHYLHQRGIKNNDLVAVCLNRTFDLMVTLLAIQKAGAGYVPIDPSYPHNRRHYILNHSQPSLIITEQALLVSVQEALVGDSSEQHLSLPWLSVNQTQWFDHNNTVYQAYDFSSDNLALPIDKNQLAYTLYTSGSTGNPKGVAISRGAFVNFLCAMQKEVSLTPDDCLLAVTTISFDIAGLELFLPIITGASFVLATTDQARDPAQLNQLIQQQRVTVMQATPVTWQMLVNDNRGPNSVLHGLKALCGGEALNAHLANALLESGVTLLNVYGPTETTVWSTCHSIRGRISAPAAIGRPIGNNQCYVLDKYMQPLPLGSTGELYIGGAGLAQGYLHRDDLTQAAFVKNPFRSTPGDRLYRTGDKARYLPGGILEYQGRADFQVKIRGFRIELAEIEQQLMEHSDVDRAIANAWQDPSGNLRLVAYIVGINKPSRELNPDQLRHFTADRLPQYMVPEFVVFLDAFPLTDNGKINRKKLPVPDLSTLQRAYSAPETNTEKWLCDTWQLVLNIENVGVEDNFFSLGGHSLLATRIIALVNQHFEIALPVKVLFTSQTPRALAESIDLGLLGENTGPQINILKADQNNKLLASFAQQRLWMLDKIEQGSSHYHLPAILRLDGELNYEALSFAFNTILSRHESLRTCFRAIDNQVEQRINDTLMLDIIEHDLSGNAAEKIESSIHHLNAAFIAKAFDLANDLMLRVQVIRIRAHEHVLCIVLHHIAADGWSMSLLIKEFKELYQAFLENRAHALPQLDIQYSDYAQWQRGWLQGENLNQQLHYWKEQLDDIPVTHNLPLDFTRPKVQSFSGACYVSYLKPDVSNSLKSICQQSDATLFMGLHAVFSVLLARYSNEKDIVIGSPIANREQSEISNLIGFFVNTLVLRSNLTSNPNFHDLLDQSKNTLLSAYQHQQLPFEQLVDYLQPERGASHSPLFQIMLSLQNNEQVELSLPGLTVTPQAIANETTQFDLTLEVSESSSGLTLRWLYNRELFKPETMVNLADHFNHLVDGIVSEPQRGVMEVDLLGSNERNKILRQWHQIEISYPVDVCLHQHFEQQVSLTPNAVAIVSGDESLTYQQLNASANKVAHYLLEQWHIKPDERVGIYQQRSISMIVHILAVLKAGAAYVPLDTELPIARVNYMCEDAGLRVILTDSEHKATLTAHPEFTFSRDKVSGIDRIFRENNENYGGQNVSHNTLKYSGNSLAYVIYTSGSTGKPKGVMVERKGLRNLLHWYKKEYKFTPDDQVLIASSMGFDLTQKNIFAPLLSGATLVLHKVGYFDPAEIVRTISDKKITITNCAPSLFSPVLDCAAKENYLSLSSLRLLLVGGESLTHSGFSRWLNHSNCNAQLINMYGPTEATDIVTVCNQGNTVESNLIGNSIANVETYVLNDSLQLQPVSVVGELYVGGIGVARGYLNDVEKTSEKFIVNPFVDAKSSNQRLYKTGDNVRRLESGALEFVGRIDHEIKIRGFRVALGEIETVISQFSGIKDAVVNVIGEGNSAKILAYVVLDDVLAQSNSGFDEQNIKTSVAATLPNYMVPTQVLVLDTLPLTANGKINRQSLPVPNLSSTKTGYVAPSTDIENVLCQIWQDVLGMNHIGINDNFFQLGGHSLLVIQVISQAQNNGITLAAPQIFDAPTVKQLAAVLTVSTPVSDFIAPVNGIPKNCTQLLPEMLPLIDLTAADIALIASKVPGGTENIQDIYPLAPLQEGILFHHMMSSDSDPYVLPNVMTVPDESALREFIAALEFVINRHDVLRTAVLWEGLSAPVQVVHRQVELCVDWLEIPTHTTIASYFHDICAPEMQWLDVTSAPLLKIQVAKEPVSQCHYILLQFHHLISDHEGLEIIQREMALFMAGDTHTLTPAHLYREFVAHSLYQNAKLDVESFFGSYLSDVEEPTFPFNLQNTQGNGGDISELRAPVPDVVANSIRIVSQQLGVTPASIFHLAWAMVVAACSGSRDVIFGTVLSGRLQGTKGVSDTLGVFMNTLPIRFKLNNPELDSIKDHVFQSHRHLSELLPYEQCSLAHASRCSSIKADTPLFSAIINYRHSNLSTAVDQSDSLTVLNWHERTNYPFNLAVDNYAGKGFGLELQVNNTVDVDRVLSYTQEAIRTLVEHLCDKPDASMKSLSVVPQSLLQHHNRQWNHTARDYTEAVSFEYLFEQQAIRTGDNIAASFAEDSITYRQLHQLSNQLAHYLQSQGVGCQQRVVICQHRSVSMLISLLAVLKTGAVYVPIDPSYPKDRVLYMLEDATAVAVLTDDRVLDSRLFDTINNDALIINVEHCNDLNKAPISTPKHSCDGHQLAYMIYTSGSTGKPKAVQLTRANLLNFLCAMKELLEPGENDRLLAVTSLSFDIAVLELFLPLICGAQVIIGDETLAQDGFGIKSAIERFSVNMMQATPVSWKILLAADWLPVTPFKVLCGGEPFPGELAQQLSNFDALNIWNLYGPTETTVWSSAHHLNSDKKHACQGVPIGQPIANTQLYILDDVLNPAPIGVPGELFIGGDGVARGYLGQPHLTDERFIETSMGRLYRTGDLARQRNDGVYECLGRLDHQVKIRGFRIELGEIETELARHEGIQDVAVHAHEIHGESQLVAYLVLVDHSSIENLSSQASSAIFQEFLQSTLPGYMIPSMMVVLDRLPLTPNGKVDRKQLSSPSFIKPQQAYVAPRNSLETRLQTIWQNLLVHDRVGINDNFFQLGGHSLLATRLMMRCREEFQVKLQLADLFNRQTIADMAELIEHAQLQVDSKTSHLDDASISRIDDLLSEFED